MQLLYKDTFCLLKVNRQKKVYCFLTKIKLIQSQGARRIISVSVKYIKMRFCCVFDHHLLFNLT